MSDVTGIQGQTLEVTVVGLNRFKDTEGISRQDPYVCLEYGSTKVRTRTCTDGGTNPTFQEKFLITLVEGLIELNVKVWTNNTFAYDNFIGSGRVNIQKVISKGFDDTAWTIQSKSGRYAGEVCLIMHYSNANKPMTDYVPSAPQYCAPPPYVPSAPQYCAPPPPPPVYSAPAWWPPAAAPYWPAPLYPSVHPPSPYSPQLEVAYSPKPSMYLSPISSSSIRSSTSICTSSSSIRSTPISTSRLSTKPQSLPADPYQAYPPPY